MLLKMMIGNMLIDQVPLNCDNMSIVEKQDYYQLEAARLFQKHYDKILEAKELPQFFIQVNSKMNFDL
jgi:hypothetical protein